MSLVTSKVLPWLYCKQAHLPGHAHTHISENHIPAGIPVTRKPTPLDQDHGAIKINMLQFITIALAGGVPWSRFRPIPQFFNNFDTFEKRVLTRYLDNVSQFVFDIFQDETGCALCQEPHRRDAASFSAQELGSPGRLWGPFQAGVALITGLTGAEFLGCKLFFFSL